MMSLLPLLPRPSSLLAAKAWSSPPSSSSSFVTCSVMAAKRWRKKNQPAFQSELRNPVAAVYGGSEMTAEKGHIYDHKPFRVRVEKYQVYDWCGCGLSHMQPFCDGTHTNRYIKRMIRGGPVRYIAPETRDVWFCNCKQTNHRPFCDGTHKTQEVKEANVYGHFDLWEPKGRLPESS